MTKTNQAICLLGGVFAVLSLIAAAMPVQPDTPVLERREIPLNGAIGGRLGDAKGLVLAVREPIGEEPVRALIDANRRGYELVRVFTYRSDQTIGKDVAVGLWEWQMGTLMKRY